MSLLTDVAAVLRRHEIAFAMIGAGAMAVHGVSRSTADIDLLTMDPDCLDVERWRALTVATAVDIRSGDADDPLRGVVRFSRHDEPDLDLIVGRPAWQREVLARASLRTEDGISVVGLADLMLLKLYAGGSQDAWDIEQLLAVDAAGGAAREVDDRLNLLPAGSRRMWERIRSAT